MINIVVCLKQVTDPEAPALAYAVDAEAKQVILKGIPPVISPFDENALEAALRIKDIQESKITAISLGRSLSRPVLLKALAAGADELILLEDEAFERLDGQATARVLIAAIGRLGKPDLILTGRQAADTNAGVVGFGIAELLGLPVVSVARKVEIKDGWARVERVIPDGYEVIEAPLPLLVTVSNELGQLRYPSMQQLVAARKKPVTTWRAADLGLESKPIGRLQLRDLFIPQREVGRCDMVTGESPEEMGANLALKLREAHLL